MSPMRVCSAVLIEMAKLFLKEKQPGTKLHVIITQDITAVPVDPLKEKTIYGFVLNPKSLAQALRF